MFYIPEVKYFAPLINWYIFIKFFANIFVNIILTFSDSWFNSSECFVLFEVIFLFNFFSLLLKSVSFTKSAISGFVAKFACFNIAVKFSTVQLLE